MKKLLIYIVIGIVVAGAGIGIAFAAGLFDKDKDKKTDTPIAVTSVTIDGKSTIVANDSTAYTAVVLPADATDKTVTWAVSSGPATITEDGVLTTTGAGTVIITATSNNSKVGMKAITVYADQTTADNAAITAARNSIENANYTVSQSVVINMETANDFIKSVIDGLELDSGITADIMEDEFHAATPGTQGDADGEDGSYSFTVTLNKGVGAEQSTVTITMTITAIPYDSEVEEQDNAAIGAAKTLIEGATYTANQTDAIDMVTAKTSIQSVIDGLPFDDGIHYVIINGTFTDATAGTALAPDGTDGSFTFTVRISKGLGAEQPTDTLTLEITATAYDSTEQDNLDIAAAKAAIEGATYAAVTQTAVDDIAAARAEVQAVLDTLSLNSVSATIVDGVFTPAIAGTALDTDGTDGSYKFTVNLTKGSGDLDTTIELTLAITATAYDSTEQDNLDIAAVKTAIEGATYSAVAQEDINDIAAARAEVQAVLDTLSLNGVTATIVDGEFTPAQEGTPLDPDGEDGSYKFTVDLTKGSGVDTTIELTLEITATAYDSTDDDNAAITAAKALIEGANYSAPQTTIIDAASAISTVETIISGLSLDGGITTVINEVDFDAAQAGDIDNPNGENGTFTFTVKLSKGHGDEQTTNNLTLDIIATPYDDNARVAAAKAAITEILDANENTLNTDNSAGVQAIIAYIGGLINHIGSTGSTPGGLYNVILNINPQITTYPVDSTITNATKTDGIVNIDVTIICGTGTEQIIDNVIKTGVTITAKSTYTDTDTIKDAREIIAIALPSTVSSANANTLSDLQAIVNGICDPVKQSHNVEINTNGTEFFDEAVDGIMPEVGSETSYIGKDGIYTCTITINKNNGTQETVNVSITIEAQDFVTTQLVFNSITEDSVVVGYEVSANGLGAENTGIVIPSEYNNLPVLRIAGTAPNGNGISQNSTIKVVVIMDGVKEIGLNAFYNCMALQKVVIPNSVEIIESGAFQACINLDNVTLPENEKYTVIESSLFQGATALTSITIPGKVTTIGASAFGGCEFLETVTMGESVETIGNSAFNGCTALAELHLPASVKSIGGMAFSNMGKAFDLYIENPDIQFRAVNIFGAGITDTRLTIHYNGTQTQFESLKIFVNNNGTWEAGPDFVYSHATALPISTVVNFIGGASVTYHP